MKTINVKIESYQPPHTRVIEQYLACLSNSRRLSISHIIFNKNEMIIVIINRFFLSQSQRSMESARRKHDTLHENISQKRDLFL